MLLTLTTTHYPASDLSYLLHKHPSKIQSVNISAGKAHVFYTAVNEDQCTAVLLLEIDPVGLVRGTGSKGSDFALEQYVNDRPYVASSLMSAAIAKAFSSALNGHCKDKPELTSKAMPFEVKIAVLPVRGGEELLRKLFEPLGYSLEITSHLLDPSFPDWGDSRYFTVVFKNTVTLQQLLTHLYVLIPVCDNNKHYWVTDHEVEKLLEKGKGWLENHPERDLIIGRYLKHQKSLTSQALNVLLSKEEIELDHEYSERQIIPKIHDIRLLAAKEVLLTSGAERVADLGCGEGKLIKLLLEEKQFDFILGMDISYRSLEIAKEKLRLEQLPGKQAERVKLIQGSLTYRDERLSGFDAATLIEVIEHLDEPRLAVLEQVVFAFAKPKTVIVTTPNADYNIHFADYKEGKMRHADHRFEWGRKEFENWTTKIALNHGYDVIISSIGEEVASIGALSQMAVFKVKQN